MSFMTVTWQAEDVRHGNGSGFAEGAEGFLRARCPQTWKLLFGGRDKVRSGACSTIA